MSARNLTLYIPGNVAQKMDRLQEVNWSKIAREAIERYIDERLDTSIPPEILSTLRNQKGDEFTNGKKLATETIAPNLSYKKMAIFFKAASERAENARKYLAAMSGLEEEQLPFDIETSAIEIIRKEFNEIPKGATDEFCRGVFSVLDELWHKI